MALVFEVPRYKFQAAQKAIAAAHWSGIRTTQAVLVDVPKEFWEGHMPGHYYVNPRFAQGDLDYPTPYDIHDSDRLAVDKRRQTSFEYAAWLRRPSRWPSTSKSMVSKLMLYTFLPYDWQTKKLISFWKCLHTTSTWSVEFKQLFFLPRRNIGRRP
uniref:Uncharacterized protein n=1 Tax=Trichuris muris TaxID=70415 RepID=A0A5S6QTW5_TRIMR